MLRAHQTTQFAVSRVAGITNGSNTMWLTSADFDQNGIAYIDFEWNGEGSPRMCTFLDIFITVQPPQN